LAKRLVPGKGHLLSRVAVICFETEPLTGFGIDVASGNQDQERIGMRLKSRACASFARPGKHRVC
jgi:hypothetical protein